MKGVRISALIVAVSAFAGLVAGCAETEFVVHSAKRVVGAIEEPPPPPEYKVGKPYQIQGVWYYPREDFDYEETGIASWYGAQFHGRKTANGDIYDMNALTAAHRTLPMPSYVRVTNLENGRSLILKVNDRGPFARGRIIDVSRRASQLLGFQKNGTARVRVQIMADQSRAIAARLRGQAQLAKIGTPITVDRLPKPKVSTQALPPPGDESESTDIAEAPPAALPSPAAIAEPNEELSMNLEPADAKITVEAVKETQIFVQAGAFSLFENANRVRARLTPIGPVKLTSVLINGKDLYRVRVGPLKSVGEADRMLDSVSRAGYPEARIIVE